MISPERLAVLQFQAKNHGFTASSLERMQRDGINPDGHGSMIQITGNELREFLRAYNKEQSHELPDAAT